MSTNAPDLYRQASLDTGEFHTLRLASEPPVSAQNITGINGTINISTEYKQHQTFLSAGIITVAM